MMGTQFVAGSGFAQDKKNPLLAFKYISHLVAAEISGKSRVHRFDPTNK